MTTLQSARKYEELLSGEVEASPYEYTELFRAEGFRARRAAKARFKVLKGLDPKLRRILHPEERVYFLTWGTTVSLAEQFFVGWVAHYINMRALVFTTERVLLLQVDRSKRKAKHLVSQIPYSALASVKSRWNGTCQISLTDKTKHQFVHVPKADRKFIAGFLGDLLKDNSPATGKASVAAIQHLCPHCFSHVPQRPATCNSCGGGLKSPSKAGWLSLIFPGVGDWYLGHRGFAVLELMGSAFLWFIVVVAPLVAQSDPEMGPIGFEYWSGAALVIGMAHGIDALMTRHFALKGHHPAAAPPQAALPPVIAGAG